MSFRCWAATSRIWLFCSLASSAPREADFCRVTANGNRPNDNNYVVDGLDDNDAYYGTTVINAEGVEGTPATHLPIDAIQEFNVQSSPEADYGWKPGAIINIGIKSGTNSFHGSTYYFNRNSALDARNWFNPGPGSRRRSELSSVRRFCRRTDHQEQALHLRQL